MLKNAMSNTPSAPASSRRGNSQTWVKSQWKNPAFPGHFSVEINRGLFDERGAFKSLFFALADPWKDVKHIIFSDIQEYIIYTYLC
jgi:hypothetical protein